MIKMQVIGNIGRDAIINISEAGSVANFSVAHTDRWKANGVTREKTVWVNCSIWDKEALHPYLKKGTKVYLEGAPEASSYVDREGKTVLQMKMTVHRIELLGSANKANESTQDTTPAAANGSASGYSGDDVTDDLPF